DKQAPDADERLLVEAAIADASAFALLYRKYLTPVYRYVYQQVGNAQDAEDLTATTFSEALASLPRYEARGSFAAWLFGIARHVLLRHRRAHRSEVDVPRLAEVLPDPAH